MATYTFPALEGNHVITATFIPEGPTPPTPADGVRMFVKLNGVWKPLFDE